MRHGRCLPRMWRRPPAAWRGRRRATGVRADQLPREPPCSHQAGVHLLRRHRPGAGTEPTDRARHAGPGLLALVLVAKFADHLPLYRQTVIYAREGVDLDRALLASWVGAASALLRPLVDAIRPHVLAASTSTVKLR